MKKPIRYLSLCGLLGYGYAPESLKNALDTELDFVGVDILIHSVKGAEIHNKVRGTLGAYTRNTGDIIGGVAHQRFQIRHFYGFKSVFFDKLFFGV